MYGRKEQRGFNVTGSHCPGLRTDSLFLSELLVSMARGSFEHVLKAE